MQLSGFVIHDKIGSKIGCTKGGACKVEKIVSYRHNTMQINSLDTFLGVKGGYNHAVRDVYFVRALGEDSGYSDKICQADRRMGAEMAKARLRYVRLKSLPRLSNAEDIAFYAGKYDGWRQGGRISLRNISMTEPFGNALSAGLAETLGKYQSHKKQASESMVRNCAAKYLFWLDTVLKDVLSGWSEGNCMKILAEDVRKEQEYLFYYLATLLGCDVILLENQKDVEVSEDLKNLSQKLVLGPFGTSRLPEYAPYVPQEEKGMGRETGQAALNRTAAREAAVNGTAADNGGNRGSIRVTIPERNRHRSHPPVNSPQNPPANSPQNIRQPSVANTAPVRTANAEKTFEELAQLASSIVMIAVHDSRREVIGTGSGIMIGRGGYILTNDHVVSGGRFFSVRMEDDEEIYPTDEVIKYNYNLDLAVIRISKQLSPLPIYNGAQKLVRGQKVVAIGSPLGLFNSVSDGIISGFRNIRDVDMIQFTAPISPGSSGGAVLNMQGEVIGISTAGFDDGQNINLAVSYEDIRMFARGFY